MTDNVDSPKHYIGLLNLEVRIVHLNFVPKFLKWGVMACADAKDIIKYILRAPEKNGLEDLKKARKHLNWLIEEVEKQEGLPIDRKTNR